MMQMILFIIIIISRSSSVCSLYLVVAFAVRSRNVSQCAPMQSLVGCRSPGGGERSTNSRRGGSASSKLGPRCGSECADGDHEGQAVGDLACDIYGRVQENGRQTGQVADWSASTKTQSTNTIRGSQDGTAVQCRHRSLRALSTRGRCADANKASL